MSIAGRIHRIRQHAARAGPTSVFSAMLRRRAAWPSALAPDTCTSCTRVRGRRFDQPLVPSSGSRRASVTQVTVIGGPVFAGTIQYRRPAALDRRRLAAAARRRPFHRHPDRRRAALAVVGPSPRRAASPRGRAPRGCAAARSRSRCGTSRPPGPPACRSAVSPSGSFADTASPMGWPDGRVLRNVPRRARVRRRRPAGRWRPCASPRSTATSRSRPRRCAPVPAPRTPCPPPVRRASPTARSHRAELSVLQPRPISRWRRSYFIGGPVFSGALQLTDRLLPLADDRRRAPASPAARARRRRSPSRRSSPCRPGRRRPSPSRS